MEYIYICNALPELINNYFKGCVSGNKFSLNLAKSIDIAVEGKLNFISLSYVDEQLLQEFCGGEIWQGKPLIAVSKKNNSAAKSLFTTCGQLKKHLKQYIKSHKTERIALIIENSPFASAVACAAMKKFSNVYCYSITIDTAFTESFSKRKGLVNKLKKYLFKLGQKKLKKFDGLITFTNEVQKNLMTNIPCLEFAIGCNEEDIPLISELPVLRETDIKKVVYAGSLMKYNGIQELLDAFVSLGDDYQLHLYGYGEEETKVRLYSQKFKNIIFHGRFDPEDTINILSQYDLLINPRKIDRYIENYTFPSKLVDYILTGKSVLTSKFKTLPKAYNEFLYLIDEMTAEGLMTAVKRVFSDSLANRREKAINAIKYLSENQTYDKIAKNIVEFINSRC